jgi:hypothetical protein
MAARTKRRAFTLACLLVAVILLSVGLAIANIYYSYSTLSSSSSSSSSIGEDPTRFNSNAGSSSSSNQEDLEDLASQNAPTPQRIRQSARINTSTGIRTNPTTTTTTTNYDYDYEYTQIYNWTVPPDNPDFQQIPYRQFCRYRNHLSAAGNKNKNLKRNRKPGKRNAKSSANNINTSSVKRKPFSPMEEWVPVMPFTADHDNLNKPNNSTSTSTRKILLHVQFDCYQTMKESKFGTGNWVQMMYLLRHAVLGTISPQINFPLRMDVKLSCLDETAQSKSKAPQLVMPWLVGHFSSEKTLQAIKQHYWKKTQNIDLHCHHRGWGDAPVADMAPFMQQDLRRMAIALLGLPHDDPTHPAHLWFRQQTQIHIHQDNDNDNDNSTRIYHPDHVFLDAPPGTTSTNTVGTGTKPSSLIPNVKLDDVAIHFRCGDIMASKHLYFRFLKFQEFANRMDNSTESIGIVTQSFGDVKKKGNSNNAPTSNEQARSKDQDDDFRVTVCRRVVHRFVEYLQDRFPKARVTIHNGPNETVSLAYARLVMAKKQAFAYPDSSFSVFPVLATFGIGYHMKPIGSPFDQQSTKNKWLLDVHKNYRGDNNSRGSNLQLMEIHNDQALFAVETLYMRLQNETKAALDIVNWFANDDLHFPRVPNSVIQNSIRKTHK